MAFGTSGVSVNSTSFESTTTLLANVSISRSADAGLTTVVVSNPGDAGVTGGFLFDVTHAAVRSPGLSIDFSNRSDILSSNERTRLATFSMQLQTGKSITIFRYARNRQLAAARIVTVSRFLRSRSHAEVRIEVHQILTKRLSVVRLTLT